MSDILASLGTDYAPFVTSLTNGSRRHKTAATLVQDIIGFHTLNKGTFGQLEQLNATVAALQVQPEEGTIAAFTPKGGGHRNGQGGRSGQDNSARTRHQPRFCRVCCNGMKHFLRDCPKVVRIQKLDGVTPWPPGLPPAEFLEREKAEAGTVAAAAGTVDDDDTSSEDGEGRAGAVLIDEDWITDDDDMCAAIVEVGQHVGALTGMIPVTALDPYDLYELPVIYPAASSIQPDKMNGMYQQSVTDTMDVTVETQAHGGDNATVKPANTIEQPTILANDPVNINAPTYNCFPHIRFWMMAAAIIALISRLMYVQMDAVSQHTDHTVTLHTCITDTIAALSYLLQYIAATFGVLIGGILSGVWTLVSSVVVMLFSSPAREGTAAALHPGGTTEWRFRFMVDSGASHHICNNISMFADVDTNAPTRYFKIAGPTPVPSKGVGTVTMPMFDTLTNTSCEITIPDVHYLPDQPFNLISVKQMLTEQNFESPDFKRLVWTQNAEHEHATRTFQLIETSSTYYLDSRVIAKKRDNAGKIAPAQTRSTLTRNNHKVNSSTKHSVHTSGEAVKIVNSTASKNVNSYSSKHRTPTSISTTSTNISTPTSTSEKNTLISSGLQFSLTEYKKWGKLYGNPKKHEFDVDLFTDGGGRETGTAMADTAYKYPSKSNSPFNVNWNGKFIFGCPDFTHRSLFAVLNKACSDFNLNINETSHLFIVPHMPHSSWWHFTKYFEVVHTYEADELIFTIDQTCPSYTNDMLPAGIDANTGATRFKFSLPCPVSVLHRTTHTPVQLDDYVTAHLRFGHYNPTHIARMVEQGVKTGLSLNPIVLDRCKPPCVCTTCTLAKMKRPGPFKKNDGTKLVSLEPFQNMTSDLTGPIEPLSYDEKSYSIHLTCVKTGWIFIGFLTTKDQAGFFLAACLLTIKKWGFNTGAVIIKSDNGGEYTGGHFKQVCDDNLVQQIFSSPYLHEENASAEIVWRDLGNTARAMHITSGLPACYWPLMWRHAAWIKNRMPNSNKNWNIPHTAVRKFHADLSHVRIPGSAAFAWVDPALRKKLDNKAVEYVYVGHSDDSTTYLLLNPVTGKIKRAGSPFIFENTDEHGRRMTDPDLSRIFELQTEDLQHKPYPYRSGPGDVQ